MRSTMFVAVSLCLLTLAGCGSDDQPVATPTTTTTTTATTTTTTTTTATTTTTTIPVPEVAADGANLQACEDGTCEVEVKSGDVISIRGEQFVVVSVGPEGATFVLPSGMMASIGGTGKIGTATGTNVDILRNNGTTVMIRVS